MVEVQLREKQENLESTVNMMRRHLAAQQQQQQGEQKQGERPLVMG